MQKLLDWFQIYFVSSKAVVFIWGLVLSYGLAEYAVMSVLIDYLEDHSNLELSLMESTMIMNLIDGGSAVFVVIVAHISAACTGHFKMIIFCSAAYVAGLWLTWLSSTYLPLFNVFYVAVVLLALGKAGRDPPLESFLEFQVSKNTRKRTEAFNGENENEQETNKIPEIFWSKTAWISGASLAIFAIGNRSWQNIFRVCGSVMLFSNLFFLFGFKYYHHENRMMSPLTSIYRVFKAAILNRRVKYASSVETYYWKDHRPNYWYSKKPGELRLLPRAPFPFKFLDKAAILREGAAENLERQEEKGELCTVKEVRKVKRLTQMVYLGLCFYGYSLAVAAGNTYFVLQGTSLDRYVGGFEIPVLFLFVLKSFVRDVVIYSFRWLGLTQQDISTWKIGAGMFCAVLCCITAWQVELHRLSSSEPLSILVLIPQYFLLGLMEGLAENGLAEFFYNFMPESINNFNQPFSEIVLNIGKFFSIPLMFICGSWFKETIDTSQLKKYFGMLAILNAMFLCIYLIYLYWSSRSKFMEEYPEDEELAPMELIPQASHDAVQAESQEPSVLERMKLILEASHDAVQAELQEPSVLERMELIPEASHDAVQAELQEPSVLERTNTPQT